ncbi:hypothetical protein [Phytoactinopolyspora mesophila]|uniref:Uncharacterized protein n=1 Tax=Phytoactinopolyspora mesophila TaxID=2650750 RepID=A0A7K3M1N1_9ACTN|nr:hypothetical protein [Phytoactinopolyspora mesophila]NDL57150.1 hypothetical protein [Phytoactinopolyspora mesophila]
MTAVTLVVGGLLTLAGIIAYAVSDAASATALIPSVVGVLLLVCGLLARKASIHKHAIHAAMVIALLGALGSLMNVVQIGDLIDGTAERPAAIVVSIIMFVILVAYLVLGVRSFISARRQRVNP